MNSRIATIPAIAYSIDPSYSRSAAFVKPHINAKKAITIAI
jgi:hypothetical protein